MTKSELIKKLTPYGNDDTIILIGIGIGWANIEVVRTDGVNIVIDIEVSPLFPD